MSFHRLLSAGALCALSAVLSSTALAASARWDTSLAGSDGSGASSASPWATGSVAAEWNVFDSTTTDSTPDIAGSGSLSQLNPAAGSFLTGTGNLYSAGGAAVFSATLDTMLNGTWTVWLRTATQGTSLDSVATLNGVTADKTVSYSAALGGFGGSEEEAYWRWTVTDVSSLQFSFGSSAAHTSLDQLAIFAAPVPEQSTWLSLAAGLSLLGALARRRA